MNETIGFIGLGIMGLPMAKNLLRKGYPLVGHDIDREAIDNVVELGATKAHSPKELAQRSEVIVTMLPDSPDVELVALGNGGLIEGVHEGQVYVDMSTIAPSISIQVAEAMIEKGVLCLDAPVSGGEVGAIEGTLSIMVGGKSKTLDRVRSILETMGRTITHCGPAGAGQIVKACNQIQVALNLIGMAEALVLGAKAGVDPSVVIEVLSGGYAQTRVMDVRGPRVIQGDFRPGFKSKFHYKDLNIIQQTAREYGCPLPATAVAHELFAAMLAAGRQELDHSGILTVIEDMARVQARASQTK